MKYSAMMLEKPSAPPPPPTNPPSDPLQLPTTEQDCPPSLDLSSAQIQPISHPAATSSPQQQSLKEHQDPSQESGPMLYLSETLQDWLTADGVVKPASDPAEGAPLGPSEPSQTAGTSDVEALQNEPVPEVLGEPSAADPAAAPSKQPTKPKKDKLAILKKLGLDPPPVAKLCPDDGAFIQLEPPQPRPGKCFSQDISLVRRTTSTVTLLL